VVDVPGLGPAQRRAALERMGRQRFDVLVVGGGVSGCGVALDAATRGLSVALVERGDIAAGTSSRSGKLIHGGLRYMEQLRFGLVRESLRERALLLRRLCPHLVRPMRFMYLLEHRAWERTYLGAGLVLYDTLGGAGALPRHRHLSRSSARRLAPGVRADAMTGAVTFYDTQCDDARHTLTVARTAAAYGAQVVTRAEVVGFARAGGRVGGAVVRDLVEGEELAVEARHVVNATGVWTEELQALAAESGDLRVRASKGVHLVVPRDRIEAGAAFVVRAERDPMIFVRPWNDGRYWMFGTTDTPWELGLDDPVVTGADVDYLLRNVNRVLATPLRADDVVGAFAGLRPLVSGGAEDTSRISREHAVAPLAPGVTAVAGGKYTTYRVMAADAVDAAARDLGGAVPGSCTADVPLAGAAGWPALWNARARLAAESGLAVAQVERLLRRYGDLVGELLALVRERPDLAEPLTGGAGYLRVEARYAASHEGALDLDDVLARRLRVAIEAPDRGAQAAAEAGELVADVLDWDGMRLAGEIDRYRRRVAGELAALHEPDDARADAARRSASAAAAAPLTPKEG
jgi:glycerol-3-phosphate dehydrogenase